MNNIKSKYQFLFIFELFLLFIYLLFIFLEIKEFVIWPQITEHLNDNTIKEQLNVIENLFLNNHPHSFRVMLLFPFFFLSELFNLNLIFLFSIVMVSCLFITYKIIMSILFESINIKFYPIVIIFLFILSFLMNGRIIFAILGNTLILFTLFKNEFSKNNLSLIKTLFIISLGIWLTCVSSGTLMVGIGTILLFYFIIIIIKLPLIKQKSIYIIVLILLLMVILSPILIQLINKNLDFYNGSFILMLDHGIGKYILKFYVPILILIIFSPFFIVLSFNFLKNNKIFVLPISMILSSSFIGLFGFSSLVSGLSAYILFCILYINKKRLNCEQNTNK